MSYASHKNPRIHVLEMLLPQLSAEVSLVVSWMEVQAALRSGFEEVHSFSLAPTVSSPPNSDLGLMIPHMPFLQCSATEQ